MPQQNGSERFTKHLDFDPHPNLTGYTEQWLIVWLLFLNVFIEIISYYLYKSSLGIKDNIWDFILDLTYWWLSTVDIYGETINNNEGVENSYVKRETLTDQGDKVKKSNTRHS